MWLNFGPSLAKLLDHVFRQPLWKPFGEHLGEEEEVEEREEQGRGGGGLLGASWGTVGASWELPGGLLEASWGPPWASWAPLGAS